MGSLSGTLYIGITSNLRNRVFQHKFHRLEGFTDKYEIERLLYWESFDDVHKAIAREKQLKGWRRSKKIALIESLNPHWLDLAWECFPGMKGCNESSWRLMTPNVDKPEAPNLQKCHSERNNSASEANEIGESKDP
jgi:putative endonuclease